MSRSALAARDSLPPCGGGMGRGVLFDFGALDAMRA
jgi:hypothetical protein